MTKKELIIKIVGMVKEYPSDPSKDNYDEVLDQAFDTLSQVDYKRAFEVIGASDVVEWETEAQEFGDAYNLNQLAYLCLQQLREEVRAAFK